MIRGACRGRGTAASCGAPRGGVVTRVDAGAAGPGGDAAGRGPPAQGGSGRRPAPRSCCARRWARASTRGEPLCHDPIRRSSARARRRAPDRRRVRSRRAARPRPMPLVLETLADADRLAQTLSSGTRATCGSLRPHGRFARRTQITGDRTIGARAGDRWCCCTRFRSRARSGPASADALAAPASRDHRRPRGFGESPLPAGGYRIADLADDVAALLDGWASRAPPSLGMSMGGYTALAFAVQHPDRLSALVLCRHARRRRQRRQCAPGATRPSRASAKGVDAYLPAACRGCSAPDARRRAGGARCERAPRGAPPLIAGHRGAARPTGSTGELAAILCPTLVRVRRRRSGHACPTRCSAWPPGSPARGSSRCPARATCPTSRRPAPFTGALSAPF